MRRTKLIEAFFSTCNSIAEIETAMIGLWGTEEEPSAKATAEPSAKASAKARVAAPPNPLFVETRCQALFEEVDGHGPSHDFPSRRLLDVTEQMARDFELQNEGERFRHKACGAQGVCAVDQTCTCTPVTHGLLPGALTVNLLAYVTALWSMLEIVKSRDGTKIIGSLGAHKETEERMAQVLNWMASAEHCPATCVTYH